MGVSIKTITRDLVWWRHEAAWDHGSCCPYHPFLSHYLGSLGDPVWSQLWGQNVQSVNPIGDFSGFIYNVGRLVWRHLDEESLHVISLTKNKYRRKYGIFLVLDIYSPHWKTEPPPPASSVPLWNLRESFYVNVRSSASPLICLFVSLSHIKLCDSCSYFSSFLSLLSFVSIPLRWSRTSVSRGGRQIISWAFHCTQNNLKVGRFELW